MEIGNEKEAEKVSRGAAAIPEDEKEEAVEAETAEATEKSETAGSKLVGKRRGRAPIEGMSLRRVFIFVSPEDLERLNEDGRQLSMIGREALSRCLHRPCPRRTSPLARRRRRGRPPGT